MKHSEQINEISAALAKAQAKMGAAIKDSTNPHFRSKYADLAAVVDAVREPLTANGIAFTQWAESSDGGVVVVTMLSHASGQWMSGETLVPVSKADAQGYGSAITYGRRYGLQTACGLPADDDDGNAAAKAAPITPAGGTWEAMSEDEKRFLQGIADKAMGMSPAEAFAYIEGENLDADEKVALWTRFDSKFRSAMKAAKGGR